MCADELASKRKVNDQNTHRLRNGKMLSLPTFPYVGLLIHQPANFH